jgi:hypothetical protein
MVYCCEGFKKMFIKNPSINYTLSSLETYQKDDLLAVNLGHVYLYIIFLKSDRININLD